jgi:tRNA dimethylallyltransferase
VRVPLITGPTAVGKTAVAISLAQAVSGDIVSCDSRQLYAELKIGTARPTDQEIQSVPHHFIGEVSIKTPWSAGQFARAAEERMGEILDRGRVPIVVGGSTLYIQALVEGLADIPPTDPAIRAALNEKLDAVGSERLFEALQHVDPVFAETLDATKSQRILRGLEVYASTGRPLSDYFLQATAPRFEYDIFVLRRDRKSLYQRIDLRVSRMIESGLLDEVHRLMESGFDPESNPLRTIGYSELAGFFRGATTMEQAVALIQRNSRRYAKRQETWFRALKDTRSIEVDQPELTPEEAAGLILEQLSLPS